MPSPSMPPRRLITTTTLPPRVAPNDVCRSASPNIDVATTAPLVAARPARNRRRDTPEASSYSAQQASVAGRVGAVCGTASTSAAHVVRRVQQDDGHPYEQPRGQGVLDGDRLGRTPASGLAHRLEVRGRRR